MREALFQQWIKGPMSWNPYLPASFSSAYVSSLLHQRTQPNSPLLDTGLSHPQWRLYCNGRPSKGFRGPSLCSNDICIDFLSYSHDTPERKGWQRLYPLFVVIRMWNTIVACQWDLFLSDRWENWYTLSDSIYNSMSTQYWHSQLLYKHQMRLNYTKKSSLILP